jgi:hypothetical protein
MQGHMPVEATQWPGAVDRYPLAHRAGLRRAPGHQALLRLATAEGAGDRCEMRNRSLADQRIFDWLVSRVEGRTTGWMIAGCVGARLAALWGKRDPLPTDSPTYGHVGWKRDGGVDRVAGSR